MRPVSAHRFAGALLLILLVAPWPRASGAYADAAHPGQAWRAKVHPRLLQPAGDETIEFLVFLKDQASPRPAAALSKAERGRIVHRELRDHANRTQTPLRRMLEHRGVEHRSLWIANMIWVRGDAKLLELLARRREVERVDPNPVIAARLPETIVAPGGQRATSAIEWNVTQINADQVWALGYEGRGVVIGGQDTGYEWDHPALIDSYLGWDGSTVDHDYHWHDAIHVGNSSCVASSTEPCDDNGHGTHTMGTMVGDDGGTNQIGVAPGARWIGCRNMDEGDGTPLTYAECFQWFVAPTDGNGQNPDPARAPDVINNSWRCPSSEGCSFNSLLTVVENTRAAGIVVVVSAGNTGSACSSVVDPPTAYAASFSVGSTDSSDNIASTSARGPVTADGSNRLKPEISAPGVSVRSSVRSGAYDFKSGTSMAGPHVAGAVALLLEARPDLRGQVDQIESLIQLSAVPRTAFQDCGGVSGLDVPNNTYGYGRIDALAMLQDDADADGVANLSDCLPLDGTAWGVPGPAEQLAVSKVAGGTFVWQPPSGAGAQTLTYDLLRSDVGGDFTTATCVTTGTSGTSAADATPPAPISFYLVRVRNACGENLGAGSTGGPREGSCL